MDKKDNAPKTDKRLSLSKETLRTLSDADLEQAVGGRVIWQHRRWFTR